MHVMNVEKFVQIVMGIRGDENAQQPTHNMPNAVYERIET